MGGDDKCVCVWVGGMISVCVWGMTLCLCVCVCVCAGALLRGSDVPRAHTQG